MKKFCLLVGLGLLLAAAMPVFPLPIRILATSDMHGYLLSEPTGRPDTERRLGGAAEMFAHWKEAEGYAPKDFLLISGGDIATGPPLAILFEGDPVVSVMNLMGYDVNVLGNHDFDFGPKRLLAWQKAAAFPFISANLANPDGTPSRLVAPYIINQEQEVKIAVIGLTTLAFHELGLTDGIYTTPYAEALRKAVIAARAKGAEVIIVAAHVPFNEMLDLAKEVADLALPLMLAADDHRLTKSKVGQTWVVDNGEKWHSYARIDLDYDPQTKKTIVRGVKQTQLLQNRPTTDSKVKAEIAKWQQRLEEERKEPLGYTASGIPFSHEFYNFVADCILQAYPKAQVALVSRRSLRVGLPPGVIDKGRIMDALPFRNSLVRITLNGKQLQAYLPKSGGDIVLAGLRREKGCYFLMPDDIPIAPQTKYQVILSSYLYTGSRYLRQADPQIALMYGNWWQPIYDWLSAHPTSRERPLEKLVDTKPRLLP